LGNSDPVVLDSDFDHFVIRSATLFQRPCAYSDRSCPPDCPSRVHKLKPWDEIDLRVTIKSAFESRELTMERDSLLSKVRAQEIILRELEKKHPGITEVERDENGTTILKF
jgi:hypothetical protein